MTPPLSALKEALLARSGRGAKYGLDRMTAALADLGHPERHLPVVHVAGTNGKGSVCAMVTSIARAAGLRTGTFVSPHLERIEERIALDGAPIDGERFADALASVLDPATTPLTFFETITATAFVAMRRAEVDLAVIEVGLGGRLDATNVVPSPLATAVTSVALDHCRILGSDTASIGREKAGIAKQGSPLVIGRVDAAALASIVEVAREAGAQPIWAVDPLDELAGVAPIHASQTHRVTTPRATTAPLELGLAGDHQRDNAAVAVGIAHQLAEAGLLPNVEQAVVVGLRDARWPGRLERIPHGNVEILLDCAHNPHGARALAAALAGRDPECVRLVFGALGDKAWPAMLDVLAPLAAHRYYCEPIEELAGRRPAAPGELAAAWPGACFRRPEEALERVIADGAAGDLVVVAGSIFLVGAARSALLGGARDQPIPM
jgi:dihydrofolate synthase / folylpolyglutamate synthase